VRTRGSTALRPQHPGDLPSQYRSALSPLIVSLAALIASACYSENLIIRGRVDVNQIGAALGEALPAIGLVPIPAGDLEYLRHDSQESADSSFILIASFRPAWEVSHSDERMLAAAAQYLDGHRVLVRLCVDKRGGVPYVTIEDRNEFRRSAPFETVQRAVRDTLAKFPDLPVQVMPGS
jgi:hypothetical protein